MVVAGAGFGKTTLLAQALSRSRRPAVWCSCDERLTSCALLLVHLRAGLALQFPGFGASLVFDGSPEEGVGAFWNEVVGTVSDDFVLALDDVQTLPAPAAGALALLVRDMPPVVHLAIASRAPPPFPLGRLRAERLLEIGEQELALTEEETAALLRAAGTEAGPEAVGELHRRTEGWVTGVILAARSGDLRLRPDAPLNERVFDYLAEEVLSRQPREIQDFLLDTAVLDRFTPELVAAVSGQAEARHIARGLVAAHLFTVRIDPQRAWYRYHHLLHAFLRRRLEDQDSARVVALHRRAGAAWLAMGEPLEAVRHYLSAGDLTAAVAALEPVAEHLVTTPEGGSLSAWLEEIPRRLWSRRPGLVLAHASLLFTEGRYESAYAALDEAVVQLLDAGEQERAGIALFRLLQAMVAAGADQDRAIETAERHLPQLRQDSWIVAAARILLASRYGYARRYGEAEEELRRAGSRSPLLSVYAAATRAYYVDHAQGRSAEGLVGLDQPISYLAGHEDDDLLSYLVYARVFRAGILNHLGRHEEALAEADLIQEAAERRGMARMAAHAVAWVRLEALAGLERWRELETELAGAAPYALRFEGTLYGYRHAAPAATLAAQRGDGAAVSLHVRTTRERMREYGRVTFDQPGVLCDLALAAARVGLDPLARELAQEALAAGDALGSSWARARVRLVGAVVNGPGPTGDDQLGEALALSEDSGLEELWTRRERRHAASLLSRAGSRGLGPPGTAARLGAACGQGGHSTRPLAEARGARSGPRARAPIQLVTLGGFTVWRGGAPVPDAAFGRRKARTLLALLLCARRPVHRDVVVESIWPHLPPQRAISACHVVVHGLRRALEPDLVRGGASSLVVAEGETYRLALGEQDSWDATALLEASDPAAVQRLDGEALTRLRMAEASWRAPFLPEWPYEDWAEECRQEVAGAYRTVLEAIADGLLAAGHPQGAALYYKRLIALEPERESWHRGLIRAYAGAGERALSLRQFHACRTLLRRELGIEPSEETGALYREVLRGSQVGEAAIATGRGGDRSRM
jgi:DNA-binding SARP family transcriptional activator/tetratricopeptide (TPR) repeat protein